MPLYRVKFMNHIVETYLVEAVSEDEAWRAQRWDVDDTPPVHSETVLTELHDVDAEMVPEKVTRH